MDSRKLIAGAVSGFVAAFLVDVHSWSVGIGAFDWQKAFKRWVGGAVSGASAAIGLSTLSGGA